MTDFDIVKAFEMIRSALDHSKYMDQRTFISSVCMLIEEYCYMYGLNAAEMMQMMADAAVGVQQECGVYQGGR